MSNNQINHYHLIGIKGTGMSSLACILKDLGYYVTGSDVEEDFFTSKKLKEKEIEVLLFNRDNVKEETIYIASSCYGNENVEVSVVNEKEYPLYYYHNFISEFFKSHIIGISGTHGKTTTTSIIANFFSDFKITYLIGDGTGVGIKDYEYFIFEACEYQNHILEYTFDDLIINNIDYDHPDFFESIDKVINTFQEASNKAKRIFINSDDENCKKIIHDNIISFGIDSGDIRCEVIKQYQHGYDVVVRVDNNEINYYLPFTGLHMVYNFLASFSVSYINDLDIEGLQDKLFKYTKPKRRMEEYFYYDNILIDDYAHHPKEIKMCIEGIKQKYPDKELVIVFQPHTYSRTIALEKEFKEVFKGQNLYLAKTFTSKREPSDKDLDNKITSIFDMAKKFQIHDLKEFKKLHDSVILFLGAGIINKYIQDF